MVNGHLNIADMEQGDEAVSEIDLTKLTDLAKRQLRGALGVQEPSNPQLSTIEQTLAAMKLQMDGLSREMQVVPTPGPQLAKSRSKQDPNKITAPLPLRQALSTTPSVASASTASTHDTEQLKQLISEKKLLEKEVREAAKNTSVRDALDDANKQWEKRFNDVQREKDHWMRTAQQLMGIKRTKLESRDPQNLGTPDSDETSKKRTAKS